ncbi:MAG TPA: hypothetical protein VLM75_01370 [Spirochaetota bacterium]|nr:hypothetical protein [Spirochaetota bacterium]
MPKPEPTKRETTDQLRDSKWLAERLGISYDKARSLGRENLVPNLRIGKLIKYDPHAIDAFIRERMNPARPA